MPEKMTLTGASLNFDKGMAADFPAEVTSILKDNPNLAPVSLHMMPVDTPSQHEGRSITFSRDGAEASMRSLIGKPLIVGKDYADHGEGGTRRNIGVLLGGFIRQDDNGVYAVGGLWENDYPSEVDFIRKFRDSLGASYELEVDDDGYEVLDEKTHAFKVNKWKFTGCAIIRKDKAAFPETQVLSASAQADDSGEGAKWTQKTKNDLPDSAFLLVKRPVKDKARDRALPVKDANGKYSEAHVKNAMARINQVKGFPPARVAAAKRRLARIARQLGIEVSKDFLKGGVKRTMPKLERFCDDCRPLAEDLVGDYGKEKENFESMIGEKDGRIKELEDQVTELEAQKTQLETEKGEAVAKADEAQKHADELKGQIDDAAATMVAQEQVAKMGELSDKEKERATELHKKLELGSATKEEIRELFDMKKTAPPKKEVVVSGQSSSGYEVKSREELIKLGGHKIPAKKE